MKIGTAQIDITPEPGVELCGFAKRDQPSDRVLDGLYAKIMIIESGPSYVILINLDLIGITSAFAERQRGVISNLFGIPKNQIHVFATHTHSGPGTIHLNFCGEYNPQYINELEEKLPGAIGLAKSDMEECSFAYKEKEIRLGVNRRKGEKSPLPLKLITCKNAEGKYKALFINYPMHPVCLKGRGISADYPGVMCRELSGDLPGNPVVLFGLGAAGDIDPEGVGVDYGKMREWAMKISVAASSTIRNSHIVNLPDDVKINIKQKTVKVKLYKKNEYEIDRYADKYLADNKWETEFGANYTQAVEKWRKDMKVLVGKGQGDESIIEISVLDIGGLKLILVNAELFSEFEKILQEKLRPPFMVISCANGMEGYLPDKDEYDMGGYEIETSIFFYNSFLPGKGSLETIAGEVMEFVNDQNELE